MHDRIVGSEFASCSQRDRDVLGEGEEGEGDGDGETEHLKLTRAGLDKMDSIMVWRTG